VYLKMGIYARELSEGFLPHFERYGSFLRVYSEMGI
jgi:hypothetical protein